MNAQQIIKLCITKAGSLSALARLSGRSASEIRRWRNGTINITHKNLLTLCEAVGVEMEVR